MRRYNKKTSAEYLAIPMVVCCAIACFVLTWPARADDDAVGRGAYLATAGDCVACHTLPQGGQPFAGGEAIETPFGKIYPPNITPDKTTGIGDWTDEEFIRAMWQGIGRRGEHLYPAFPYTDFTKLSERDVLDIRAYLATVPAVHNITPPNDLIFPFNIRGVMWFWNALFLDDRRFVTDPGKSAEWNRGAYLVTGMAHCGACHTPRNLFQAERGDRPFTGAVSAGWFAPNISQDTADGIGAWSDDEIKLFLRTGFNKHGVAGGPMAEAVLDSFMHLSESDLDAIVTYLRAVPQEKDQRTWPQREPVKPIAYTRPGTTDIGLMLYQGQCARCHGADGMGANANYPAIAVDRAVIGPDATNMIQIILNGADPGKLTGVKRMPAFADRLTDRQVAEIVNALLDKFHSRAPAITADTVQHARQPD